jgi:hypothetical protein
MSNITGKGATLKSKSEGWDKQTGTYTQFVWEGSKAAISGMVPATKVYAENYQIEHDGPLYRLTFRIASAAKDQGEVTDEVRMDVHRVHKSIYEPPLGGLTVDEIREVQEAVESKDEPDQSFWSDLQIELYELGMLGVTSFIVYQPVIISTSTAGPKYGFVPDYSLVGRIIHPGSIQTVVRATLPIIPPNDVYNGDGNFAYGWLQHMPTYVIVANNKAQYQVEWEYGLWSTSTLMYGPVYTAG